MSSVAPLRVLQVAEPSFDADAALAACRNAPTGAGALPANLHVSVHHGFDSVEARWRSFERVADCIPFQTFDWLSTWHIHVGLREEVCPAIAVACYADGDTAFILPLGVDGKRGARRLSWLGQDLNDYNAPLIAPDFTQRVSRESFLSVWRELNARMQREPLFRHDWVELEKMPERIGGQINPFFHLPLAVNPSGAHVAHLGDDWTQYYAAKRSSATRRRDRTKRKHLSEFGEVSFVTCAEEDDTTRTLETLMAQKSRHLAQRGIRDMFARPGWRDFFLAIAANPKMRRLVHVSRLQIGTVCGAANLGLVFGDTYYHMLASYDDGELSRYGPGALHLRELLAYAIGAGLRRFDFTIGDEPYKLEWSDTHFDLHDYAAATTWRGALASCRSNARRSVRRFIKQTPFLWRAATSLRSRIGPLLQRPPTAPQHEPPRVADAPPLASELPPQSEPPLLDGPPQRPVQACVMGDADLLRPLVLAGISCAVVSRPGTAALYSRYARSRLCCDDFSRDIERLVDQLLRFGKAQRDPPVLFYEEDAQLLLVSRFRERLAQTFRFTVADAKLVEDLVDKARFQTLASRHDLPVPPARCFHPAAFDPIDLQLRFPIVLKPLTRVQRWDDVFGLRKALAAGNGEELRALWPQLVTLDVELLAQEFVPGPEAQIESYHCYVDRSGGIAGEFTGRKIRTCPAEFGHTTALEITDAADVKHQGRVIAERIGLTGVAKFDFKRDGGGKLHLLEINPRFNLWHHPGAVAGVNIPALVFADLTGAKRPRALQARAGVRWCRMWKDFPAARAMGMPLAQWLVWLWRCETQSNLSWDDPTPLARAALHRLIGRCADRSAATGGM